ncbi:PREDICTED: tetratricopeptide repeat protein 28-like isoform X2 [Branchiostoma belcheri]|uniref:Tetratricopeptide repeat protein 28-like isoform X2 n=1 Tax=Branchiostoma belcheri TaxID=7741 RepID=A0A6P4Z3H6_BRABE|nr:PREDICTED: tetratricopeptide repeat protein 28-like isoform X2 [Branchiostoma belcheri]
MYLVAVLLSLFLVASKVLLSSRIAWEIATPVRTSSSAQNMEDLPVDSATRALVGGKMKEIELHLQKLRNDPPDAQGTENLQAIRDLMGRNLHLASHLLDNVLKDEAMDATQRLACLHLKLEIAMATGPVEDGLAAANQAYLLATTQPDIPPSALFQACLDAGDAHRVCGILDKARHFYRQARDVATHMDDTVLAETHLGILLLASGHLNKAIQDSFIPLLRQDMGQYNRGLLLQHLGNAYRSAADWGPAKDHLREAVSIAEDMGDPIQAASRYGDLGNVYRSEGRTAEALQEQEKQYNFALLRGDLSSLCTACFNKGFTFYSMKPAPDYQQALVYLTLQLLLARRLGDPGMQGKALNCLGKVYTGMQQPDQAVVLLKQTIQLHQNTGNVAGEGMAHGNLGTAYRDLGRYEEAIVNHQKYLENADSREDVGGVAIMQRELALDYLFKKDYDMAEKSIRDAVTTLERIRGKLGPEDLSRIAHNEKNQVDAYNILQHILVLQGNSHDALVMAEKGRGRALADLMSVKVKQTGKQEAPVINSIMDITTLAAELDTTIVFYSVVTEQHPYNIGERWVYCWVVNPGEKILFTKMLQVDKVQVDRGELDQGYYNTLLRSMGTLSEEAEEGQDGDETSVSEDTSDESDEDDLDRLPALKVKPSPSTQQTQEHRWETQQAWEHRWETVLHADYDNFIKPIDQFLPALDGRETAPRITFVPHGFLFSIPFCALVDADGMYLVQKYSISIAPSMQVLQLSHQQLQIHRRSQPKPSVLAVGNPFPDPARRLPALKEAEKEAEMVYKGLGASGLWLTGSNATKDCVREEMPRHTVLHFAAHASHTGCHHQTADATRATGNYSMPGYIVLSKSHNSCAGILTAEEIRCLDLSAQMVVLSCCNTGLGTVTGDGVLGMYRSFLAAGSANVVVTLWRIPDRKTRRLMRHFYSSYKTSGDAAQAMRDAMLHMLRNKKTSAPPYWAAFSVIGATAPL